MNQDRHAKALAYAIHVLAQPKYKRYIKAMYLYGSCARGTQRYSSDVDLFILIDSNTPDDLIREMRSAVISDDLDLPEVELNTSRDNTFSCSRQFNKNIEREGVLLWERN